MNIASILFNPENKKTLRVLLLSLLVLLCSAIPSRPQGTIFSFFSNDLERANEYFVNTQYRQALTIYLNAEKRKKGGDDIGMRIALCFYQLKDYRQAADWYQKLADKNLLSPFDSYYYAESLRALGDYEKALIHYKNYLGQKPDDQYVQEKIWQLNNIENLYEDSVYFTIWRAPINTSFGEIAITLYDSALVFLSNRGESKLITKVDASTNLPFYKMYISKIIPDSVSGMPAHYQPPIPFARELKSKFHEGPIAFFSDGNAMICSVTAETPSDKNHRHSMQLFFAKKTDGLWTITESFPHNNVDYSMSQPAITRDGNVLFFTSDMPGGFGGKDLYKSVKRDEQWTKPVNLGDKINTPGDESFPFVHSDNTLYFSSNGHAGMGGLDIYSVSFYGEKFGTVENLGFPVNSTWDDFSLVLNAAGTRGYLSSNRGSDQRDDDIYELEIDRQAYPLQIDGILKYRDPLDTETNSLKVLPNAVLNVIDNFRNEVVYQGTSDALGRFSVVIPHFSQYKIQVVESTTGESITSLDLPKYGKIATFHEVVVVKKVLQNDTD